MVRIHEGAQHGGCSSEEEHLIVVQDVVGSSPIIHPKGPVPKWFKGVVCKTIIRQFESDRDLIITPSSNGRTSGFGPLNGSSNLSGVTKFFDTTIVS